jgi:conjugal transfer pilus assembly protein TraE
MQLTHYKSRLQHMLAQRNGYLVLAALLAGVCLLLTISVCRLIGRERIVITPPVVNQAFWVEAKAVSPEYLSQMASFLAQLRLNLTPGNAAYQQETLLRYTDPAYYGDLKNELVSEAGQLEKTHTSLIFYPVEVTVDVKQLAADITGDLSATVGNDHLPVQRIRYQLQFRYSEGRLWLKSFEEIKTNSHDEHSK